MANASDHHMTFERPALLGKKIDARHAK